MFSRIRSCSFRLGFADVLFVFFALTIMQYASRGMMDDPGLGWHLRIPDVMVEQGGFVYEEYFSYPSTGNHWVTRAWLSDFVMRAAYGWGGLNGIAILTSLVFALTLRLIYCRLVQNRLHWLAAAAVTYFGLLAIVPSFLARPNIFAFLGMWLVTDLLAQFHAGKLKHRQLLWLIPIMLLWANMHGSFMAGIVLIAIAWIVEVAPAVLTSKRSRRALAVQRLYALTAYGAVAGLATLINPNGIGLHLYNLSAVTDPFIQNNSTKEWLPPDLRSAGFFKIELLILALPLLAAMCRKRINVVRLMVTIVWLHFALTSRRYSTLWVILALPTLCEMAQGNPWITKTLKRLREDMSDEVRDFLKTVSKWKGDSRKSAPQVISWAFAVGALLIAGILPQFAQHHPQRIPSASLNQFLEIHNGGRTFHDVNWGGYLTWKGWDQPNRFHTWIDDRIEVHGAEHLKDYFKIIRGEDGWQQELNAAGVRYICVGKGSLLAKAASRTDYWHHEYEDDYIVVFKNGQPNTPIAEAITF